MALSLAALIAAALATVWADEQNRLLMESDDRGIYGEFPPAAI